MSPDDRFTFLRARWAACVSYFALLVAPAFAPTLGLFYRNRRRPYAEHLVFGLHCQTFGLFILLLQAKLPSPVDDTESYSVIAHFVIALKRVFGGTWVETASRGVLILGLDFAIFFAASLLLVFALLSLGCPAVVDDVWWLNSLRPRRYGWWTSATRGDRAAGSSPSGLPTTCTSR